MGDEKENRTKMMAQEVGSKNGVSFLNEKRDDACNLPERFRLPSLESKFAAEVLKSPPLGLKLRKTPSLVDLIQAQMGVCGVKRDKTDNNSGNIKGKSKIEDFVSQPPSEKLKASNFPALFLKIGTWERESRNQGDLVAKCYYAKRKLVWEFLEKGLKNKIEIQWADILAIRAVIKENVPGTLEIESFVQLSQPPSFFHELDPQPRKHTQWSISTDFTGGQAPIWRRHYVQFHPGVLDKHYEKLLQCDSKLFQRSQMPFPSLESPYFEPFCITDYPYHFNGQMPEVNMRFQFPHSQISTPLIHQRTQLYEQAAQPSLTFKDSASPISAKNPWMQGLNSTTLATQVNPGYSYQIHNLTTSGGGNGSSHASSQVVNPPYSYQTREFTTFGEGNGSPHTSSQVVNPPYSYQSREFTTFGEENGSPHTSSQVVNPPYSYQIHEFTAFGGGNGRPHTSSQVVNPPFSYQTDEFMTFGGGNGSHNCSSQVPSDLASHFLSNTQVNPVNSYRIPDVTTFGGGGRSSNPSSQGQSDTDNQLLSEAQVKYSCDMKGLHRVDSFESFIVQMNSERYSDTNYQENRAAAAADVENSASYTDIEHIYYEAFRAAAAGDLVLNANEQICEQPDCMLPPQASNGNLSTQLPRIHSCYSLSVLDQSPGNFAADDTHQWSQQMDMTRK